MVSPSATRTTLPVMTLVVPADAETVVSAATKIASRPPRQILHNRAKSKSAKIDRKGGDMQYGYIRVSSTGQNVARQVDALHEAGITDDQIFIDTASGKNFNRPAWKRLVRKLKTEDMLVVQSLDRIGRNYEEILEQWRILIKVKKVDIRVLNMPLLDTANKACGLVGKLVADLVLQLFSFVAESERANIKERQRQGIDAAMKRGVKFGRPMIGNAKEIAMCVERIKNGELSIGAAAKICRVSCTTIRRRIMQKQHNF